MKEKTAGLFFDELIHDHLLAKDTDKLHDRPLVEDDETVLQSQFTQNTTAWD